MRHDQTDPNTYGTPLRQTRRGTWNALGRALPRRKSFAIGDSLTFASPYGWARNLDRMQNRNFGISGDRVVDNIQPRFAAALADNPEAEVVFINGGVNDYKLTNPTHGGDPVGYRTQVLAAYDNMIDQARVAGLEIVLLEVGPFKNHPTWWSEEVQYEVEWHNAGLRRREAPDVLVAEVYSLLGSSGDPDVLEPTLSNGDFIHWNTAGHAIVSEYIEGLI